MQDLRLKACFLCCLLLAEVVACAVTHKAGEPEFKITLAVLPAAEPFGFQEVRLLDSEFKKAQDAAVRYLLSLDANRLLSEFRKESGLQQKAQRYGGWEAMEVAGHSLGHYLSACSIAYASTGNEEFLIRVNHIVKEIAECQKAAGSGYVAAIPGGRKCFAEVATGNIRSDEFHLNGIWVPNYTLHKLMAGLRDAYRLCWNTSALEVLRGLGDWLEKTFMGLSDAEMQSVLMCEHGGISEVLADLYADTGEDRYLKLSQKFHHKAVLEPLVRGEDILPGKHANTQIPKLIGLATRYELTGDLKARAGAEFFWDRVVYHHSYATGGHGDEEYFGPPDKLNDRLSAKTSETCNVYNMLKLTMHMFAWKPRSDRMDFYERALLNHIRSSQHPDGRVIYNLSIKPGHHKEYQRLYDDFTCCVGTGMENHVRYGEAIYFQSADSLWVNLFIASEATWKSHEVKLRQETEWPDSEKSKITMLMKSSQNFTLRVRRPFWAKAFVAKVNGKLVARDISDSGYLEVKRTWHDRNVIEIGFPMAMRTEEMPDNSQRIAIFHGPTLLAADLGAQGSAEKKPVLGKYEDGTPVVTMFEVYKAPLVPVLIAKTESLNQWVLPVQNRVGTFRTVNVGKPFDIQLVPFHRLHDHNYTVYFDLVTPDD